MHIRVDRKRLKDGTERGYVSLAHNVWVEGPMGKKRAKPVIFARLGVEEDLDVEMLRSARDCRFGSAPSTHPIPPGHHQNFPKEVEMAKAKGRKVRPDEAAELLEQQERSGEPMSRWCAARSLNWYSLSAHKGWLAARLYMVPASPGQIVRAG